MSPKTEYEIQHSPWVRALVILAVLALGFWVFGQVWQLVVHFGDIILLFFLAWLLAFILLPVVRAMESRLPLGHAGAAAIVYLVLLVCLATGVVLVVPLLVDQVSQLAAQLPAVSATIPGQLDQLQRFLDERHVPVDASAFTGPSITQQAGQFGRGLVENTVSVASGIANGVFNFTLVMILSFYFVLDGDRILEQILASVPERYADDARLFTVGIDRSFGGFLRGTAIQALILGLGTGVIMTVGGLHYVLLASIFAAIVMVVPFVGPFLALVLPILIAIFSNVPTSQLILIVIALVALQFLVMNVIAPAVMSGTVGLHPLLVFLGLLVGIKQAGLAGAIFGVPTAAVIFSTARILLRRWSVIEGHAPLERFNGDGVTVTTVVVNGTRPESTIRLEQLGTRVGAAITRIFHPRAVP